MSVGKSEFPEGFLWGAGTSAYQIEGAAREDGRGESIWDRFTRRPYAVRNGDNGDVACDHYHRVDEDVALMAALGLKSYRFSISWPRVLPSGRGQVNQVGLDFYERLVDKLLRAGIIPNATLYHWDLPQAIQDAGGWKNREIAGWFADYAAVVFRRLGDRVKLWATLNESWVTSFMGHGTGVMAPGWADTSLAYQSAHHQLLAHGRAVQVFREGCYPGEIGIVLWSEPAIPASQGEADRDACVRYALHIGNLFSEPLFHGCYPQPLFDWLGEMAPQVQPGDLELISQPLDWLGINYYRSVKVGYDPGAGHLKCRTDYLDAPLWSRTGMGWGVFPAGLADVLAHYQETYGNLPLYITENGCSLAGEPGLERELDDLGRIRYLRAHFLAAQQAIQRGVNLKGYYVWSLLDNFEWAEGYSQRFGLVHVDFQSGKRTPKRSYQWYRDVIAQNGANL